MRKLMSKKGFTLVELMIVVVILGILVAVAVPIFGAVTRNARIKSCKSNQRVIKGNMETFQMTGANGDQVNITSDTEITSEPGFTKLFDGNKLPQCPSDDNKDNTDYTATIDYDKDAGITYTVTCDVNTPDDEEHN